MRWAPRGDFPRPSLQQLHCPGSCRSDCNLQLQICPSRSKFSLAPTPPTHKQSWVFCSFRRLIAVMATTDRAFRSISRFALGGKIWQSSPRYRIATWRQAFRSKELEARFPGAVEREIGGHDERTSLLEICFFRCYAALVSWMTRQP